MKVVFSPAVTCLAGGECPCLLVAAPIGSTRMPAQGFYPSLFLQAFQEVLLLGLTRQVHALLGEAGLPTAERGR